MAGPTAVGGTGSIDLNREREVLTNVHTLNQSYQPQCTTTRSANSSQVKNIYPCDKCKQNYQPHTSLVLEEKRICDLAHVRYARTDWVLNVNSISLNFINRVLLLQVLTGSKGGSRGSKTEVEEGEGEAAATEIFVHSLAVAACGDMAAKWMKKSPRTFRSLSSGKPYAYCPHFLCFFDRTKTR